ncbi:MAG: trypsin-like peptidase domain-containing protein [Candidatus Sumerlaeia bacterium]|nr:trypsin-like peptidase domain-containing protein [Candidatus Sumerlaeia bacterium]
MSHLFRFRTLLLTTTLLSSAILLHAQEAETQAEETTEPPLEESLPEVLAEEPALAENTSYYVVLKGGGEIVGRLMKQTPEALFFDLGSEVLRLSPEQISRKQAVGEALEQFAKSTAPAEEQPLLALTTQGAEGEDFLSQTDILDRVKESIVVISNPGGAGSGFVLDTQGRIVTNHHVIGGEKFHTVNYFIKNDKNQWVKKTFRNVEVEAYSYLFDMALLRLKLDEVEKEGVVLKPLPIAPAESLRVGEQVYAVGNPGGLGRLLEHSVSEGIVSSLTRNVGDVLYVQTTAAVNPGNSGGPLVNQRGEVVGLVTLKSSFQEGIGFALPTSLMHHFLEHSEAFAFNDQAENAGFRYLTPP